MVEALADDDVTAAYERYNKLREDEPPEDG